MNKLLRSDGRTETDLKPTKANRLLKATLSTIGAVFWLCLLGYIAYLYPGLTAIGLIGLGFIIFITCIFISFSMDSYEN